MFQSHQDPFKWASKRLGNSPVLVFSEGFVYLIIGTRILSSVEEGKIDEMLSHILQACWILNTQSSMYLDYQFSTTLYSKIRRFQETF